MLGESGGDVIVGRGRGGAGSIGATSGGASIGS